MVQDFLGIALIRVMRAKIIQEEENLYVGNLLKRLLSKMFDQWSAQSFPIVLPEVNDVVPPVGLGHIERGLIIIFLVPEAAEKRKDPR